MKVVIAIKRLSRKDFIWIHIKAKPIDYTINEEISAGAIVFTNLFNKVEFLIVKSKENRHWGFQKGHIEEDESIEQTTLREIFEERGLHVNLLNNFQSKIEYQLNNKIK